MGPRHREIARALSGLPLHVQVGYGQAAQPTVQCQYQLMEDTRTVYVHAVLHPTAKTLTKNKDPHRLSST